MLDSLRNRTGRLFRLGSPRAPQHARLATAEHVKSVRLWLTNAEFRDSWPAEGLVLHRIPFVVGRLPVDSEPAPASQVDLRLPDHEPFQLSRVHFCIVTHDHKLAVMDTNSHFGTRVNDVLIGRRFAASIRYLLMGANQLVVGEGRSRFRFELGID